MTDYPCFYFSIQKTILYQHKVSKDLGLAKWKCERALVNKHPLLITHPLNAGPVFFSQATFGVNDVINKANDQLQITNEHTRWNHGRTSSDVKHR